MTRGSASWRKPSTRPTRPTRPTNVLEETRKAYARGSRQSPPRRAMGQPVAPSCYHICSQRWTSEPSPTAFRLQPRVGPLQPRLKPAPSHRAALVAGDPDMAHSGQSALSGSFPSTFPGVHTRQQFRSCTSVQESDAPRHCPHCKRRTQGQLFSAAHTCILHVQPPCALRTAYMAPEPGSARSGPLAARVAIRLAPGGALVSGCPHPSGQGLASKPKASTPGYLSLSVAACLHGVVTIAWLMAAEAL